MLVIKARHPRSRTSRISSRVIFGVALLDRTASTTDRAVLGSVIGVSHNTGQPSKARRHSGEVFGLRESSSPKLARVQVGEPVSEKLTQTVFQSKVVNHRCYFGRLWHESCFEYFDVNDVLDVVSKKPDLICYCEKVDFEEPRVWPGHRIPITGLPLFFHFISF